MEIDCATVTLVQTGRVLGLPAEQAARIINGGVDYYAISPRPGLMPTIFSSNVAATVKEL